jgi:hypothetical protein
MVVFLEQYTHVYQGLLYLYAAFIHCIDSFVVNALLKSLAELWYIAKDVHLK